MNNKIEGIPDGWELVRFDKVQILQWYLNSYGIPEQWLFAEKSFSIRPIIRKIEKPKQYRPFTLEEAKYRRDRWIRFKDDKDTCFKITGYDENYIYTDQGMFIYKEALEVFVFDDTELPYGMEVI